MYWLPVWKQTGWKQVGKSLRRVTMNAPPPVAGGLVGASVGTALGDSDGLVVGAVVAAVGAVVGAAVGAVVGAAALQAATTNTATDSRPSARWRIEPPPRSERDGRGLLGPVPSRAGAP